MNKKEASSKQENTLADSLGWKVVKGSGAVPCLPGDIYSDNWLGECKTHIKQVLSSTFNLKVWKKLCLEAMSRHRFPVLFIDDGTQRPSHTACMCYLHSIESNSFVYPSLKLGSPIRLSNNIIVDIEQLESDKVYRVQLGKQDVVIMKFDTFKELRKEE